MEGLLHLIVADSAVAPQAPRPSGGSKVLMIVPLDTLIPRNVVRRRTAKIPTGPCAATLRISCWAEGHFEVDQRARGSYLEGVRGCDDAARKRAVCPSRAVLC